MEMRVLKFGGAALADGPSIRRLGPIVRARGGERPVLVASAHQGVTALLRQAVRAAHEGRVEWDAVRLRHRSLLTQLGLASDLVDRHLFALKSLLERLATDGAVERRAEDHVLSFGERMSARVVAAALRQDGIPATPVDAYDLDLVPGAGEDPSADAPVAAAEVRRRLLAVPGVPVVTGFIAVDAAGDLLTLGRNGSDLTATWLAAAVGAREVQLWKIVGGVCTADPALVPGARTLARIGWDDAAALARHGADVLHPNAGGPARRAGIPVRVLGLADPEAPGTLVLPETRASVSVRTTAPLSRPVAIAQRARVAAFVRPTGADAAAARAMVEARAAELTARGLDAFGTYQDERRTVLLLPDAPGIAEVLGGARTGRAALAVVGEGVDADERLARRLASHATRVEGSLLPPQPGSRARVLLVPAEALAVAAQGLHAELFGTTTLAAALG